MRGPELERYEILGELGQGGMSVVYRARDKQLSRVVAVKVLHEFLARQADARKRFHREAVAVAKLHHPGILEIFDYSGPDAKETYIVTELIDGVTLREMIDKLGKVPYPEIAVLIVAELIRALKHAHEQSVIHRDLKPENVMITREGQLKLMDFGLAQLMDGGTKLTATGTLLGSPAHMAPEVIDGKSSDARADLFSMGTILFWLATGKLPFEAQNPSALFKKILDGKYDDPQMVEPKIGNSLARIIQRALDPDPEQRYQDVTEIATDLESELAAAEMVPCDIHAKRYLSDPERYAAELGPRLIALLTASGKQALAENNIARAMDRFNRVLAIDPHLTDVLKIVARVGRKKELARRARQVATLATIAAIAGGASYGAVKLIPEDQPAPPPKEQIIEQPLVVRTATPAEVKNPVVLGALDPAAAKKKEKEKEKDRRKNRAEVRIASATTQVPINNAAEKPDAGGAAQPDVAAEKPKPTTGIVKLKFGEGYAAVLQIDGVEVGTGVYSRDCVMAIGPHTISGISMRDEKFERTIEIDAEGMLFAVEGPDRRRLFDNILSIRLAP